MLYMRIAALYTILFLSYATIAQVKQPEVAFRSPLDIPLILAGTFGELRSNHFHAGIDIKTQQRQGLPVYAIGEGTITRIKISLWGYGKVLYVAHPNGHTSVYGHLQKFSPKIEAYIAKVQYQKRSYEVEVFPDFGTLKLEKGEVIAYTGNTGGSSGPHLHFEIRNSVNEKPLNPLLFGLEVRDATNPSLLSLYGYPLSDDAQINQSAQKIQLNFFKQNDGSYVTDTLTAFGRIGFGFSGFDRQDMAANKNGVFRVKQLVNEKVYTDYDFESFSFAETRYINTLIDYAHFGKYKQRIQRCFKVPSNHLSIYNTIYNEGKIDVAAGEDYLVTIEISDLEENNAVVHIPIKGKKQSVKVPKKIEKTDHYIIANKPNNYDLGAGKVYFPANTFYENFYIDLKKGKDTIEIHKATVPAHRNFTITFDVSKIPVAERKKLFIARLDKRKRPNYTSTYKRGNTFTARTRNLGTYTLAQDTIPPKIRAKNFKDNQWLNNYRYLRLGISDDLSGINTYTATLNGEWILMEYEPKTKSLTYNFDHLILNKKQCDLKVVVTDNVGNQSTFTSTFYRK